MKTVKAYGVDVNYTYVINSDKFITMRALATGINIGAKFHIKHIDELIYCFKNWTKLHCRSTIRDLCELVPSNTFLGQAATGFLFTDFRMRIFLRITEHIHSNSHEMYSIIYKNEYETVLDSDSESTSENTSQ